MVKHNKIIFKCANCGKEKEQTVSNYNRRKNHFCSQLCSWDYHTALRIKKKKVIVEW